MCLRLMRYQAIWGTRKRGQVLQKFRRLWRKNWKNNDYNKTRINEKHFWHSEENPFGWANTLYWAKYFLSGCSPFSSFINWASQTADVIVQAATISLQGCSQFSRKMDASAPSGLLAASQNIQPRFGTSQRKQNQEEINFFIVFWVIPRQGI